MPVIFCCLAYFITACFCAAGCAPAGSARGTAGAAAGATANSTGVAAGAASGAAVAGASTSVEQTVDVDLTKMSGTMVFALIYDMYSKPDDYIDKTVRMSGPYQGIYYEKEQKLYHYLLVDDSSACCQQSLEIRFDGDRAYAGALPENNAYIEIVGVFKSYSDMGSSFYYFEVDEMTVA
ncbi:MAG: hypothetical protein FWH01_02950 [Oscillospiraceae bacterium]|nr:hypothetical protein [Oscillospiraceae bacterium]